jgi:hypothetical protein
MLNAASVHQLPVLFIQNRAGLAHCLFEDAGQSSTNPESLQQTQKMQNNLKHDQT